MPPIKEAPPRSCGWCGRTLERKRYNGRLEDFGVFQRRMFCGVPCMSQDFDARPVKAGTSRTVGHYHARRLVPKGPCGNCGDPKGRDIHHRNWDHHDNRVENLIRLCRSCHLKTHTWPKRRASTRRSAAAGTARRASEGTATKTAS